MKSCKKKKVTRKQIEATINLYKYLYENDRQNIPEDKFNTIHPDEVGE